MKWGAFVFLACATAGSGQEPAFETASVKPADPTQSVVDLVISPGRLRIVNLTLSTMVREAYQLKAYQRIGGGPAWKDSDRFNVDAKAAGEPNRDQMMAMLRALLEERFRLKVRRETHEGNVYELAIAKGGPKLKASTAETSYLRLYRNTPPELPGVSYTIQGQKVTIARLAGHLMGTVQRPIVDRTGIAGEFDLRIDYAVEGHAEEGPSIFTAVQEQLGLKLQAAKGPVDSLAIESVERLREN
jgi:uncharacterized protein (TIGR03435 family)